MGSVFQWGPSSGSMFIFGGVFLEEKYFPWVMMEGSHSIKGKGERWKLQLRRGLKRMNLQIDKATFFVVYNLFKWLPSSTKIHGIWTWLCQVLVHFAHNTGLLWVTGTQPRVCSFLHVLTRKLQWPQSLWLGFASGLLFEMVWIYW